jgi:hypothetical protein
MHLHPTTRYVVHVEPVPAREQRNKRRAHTNDGGTIEHAICNWFWRPSRVWLDPATSDVKQDAGAPAQINHLCFETNTTRAHKVSARTFRQGAFIHKMDCCAWLAEHSSQQVSGTAISRRGWFLASARLASGQVTSMGPPLVISFSGEQTASASHGIVPGAPCPFYLPWCVPIHHGVCS